MENRPNIKSHLAEAILVTIFCCWPFGIPAIVFAARTNGAISNGNLEYAASLSKKAGVWTLVSFIVGLALGSLYLLCVIIAAI